MIDPNGMCTEYFYNTTGTQLLTRVTDQKETDENRTILMINRTIHDVLGRVIQEIGTLQYNPANDNLDADRYTDHMIQEGTGRHC